MATIKAKIAGKVMTLLGYDGTDFQNIRTDSSGFPVVKIGEMDVGYTFPYIEAGGWMRVYPDQHIMRFADVLRDTVENLNAIAGLNNLDSTKVPAGELWVITSIVAYVNPAGCTQIWLTTLTGGVMYPVDVVLTPAAFQPAKFSGFLPLVPGEGIRAQFYGCTIGDDIRLRLNGYKMVVA